MLSKSLIQFSVDRLGCVPSLLFDLSNEDNCDLLQKVHFSPRPCSRPLLTHASTRDSWTLMGKSGSISCGVTAPFSWVLVCTRFYFALQEFFSSLALLSSVSLTLQPPSTHASPRDSWTLMGKSGPVSCGITAPFSWVLVHTRFCCALQESVSPSCVSSVIKSHWPPSQIAWGFSAPLSDPQVGKSVVGPRILTMQEFIWYNCSALCGSFAQQLYGRVTGDLLQEGLCTRYVTRYAAPRAPAPVAGHC